MRGLPPARPPPGAAANSQAPHSGPRRRSDGAGRSVAAWLPNRPSRSSAPRPARPRAPGRRRRGPRLQRGARRRPSVRRLHALPERRASRSPSASPSPTTRRTDRTLDDRPGASPASSPRCAVVHLDEKGRGRALKAVWGASDAAVARLHGRRPLDRPRRPAPAGGAAGRPATPTWPSAAGSARCRGSCGARSASSSPAPTT